jgi:hypothetical protein
VDREVQVERAASELAVDAVDEAPAAARVDGGRDGLRDPEPEPHGRGRVEHEPPAAAPELERTLITREQVTGDGSTRLCGGHPADLDPRDRDA